MPDVAHAPIPAIAVRACRSFKWLKREGSSSQFTMRKFTTTKTFKQSHGDHHCHPRSQKAETTNVADSRLNLKKLHFLKQLHQQTERKRKLCKSFLTCQSWRFLPLPLLNLTKATTEVVIGCCGTLGVYTGVCSPHVEASAISTLDGSIHFLQSNRHISNIGCARFMYCSTISYNTVHYTTIHYNALQYITRHYNTLQYITTRYTTIESNIIYIYIYIVVILHVYICITLTDPPSCPFKSAFYARVKVPTVKRLYNSQA